MSTPDVVILPAHPAEGALSMNRYWTELTRQIDAGALGDVKPRFPFSPPVSLRRSGKFARAMQKYFLYPRKARSLARNADVVHVLDHSWAHLLRGVPKRVFKIATVHDLAPLRTSDLTSGQKERFRKTVENLKLSDLILADSDHTASDVTEFLGISPQKIRVHPLGVDVSAFSTRTPARLPMMPEGPRVMSVGSTLPRKNLSILPAVFARLKQTIPNIVFLRVGEKVSMELQQRFVEVLGSERFVELGAVSDAELITLYQSVDALVFPSTYEGFGFPLLEAMAAGCAVVSSDASSLREVGGNAALYFSPDDPARAAAHLSKIFEDPATRQWLIAEGKNRVQEFSWKRHAERLREIYESSHARVTVV